MREIVRSMVAWLTTVPSEQPGDKILFDRSVERLRTTSHALSEYADEYIDETDRAIGNMRRVRKRSKNKAA